MKIDDGLFIVFEGIDGSGKSTMAQRLWAMLNTQGHDAILTHEPTDSEYGEQIRTLIHTQEQQDPREMLELFEKDRTLHVDKVIRPALEAGKIVVADRYYYSTAVYQGVEFKLNPHLPAFLKPSRILESNASRFPEPDLVIVVDCPVKVALARITLARERIKMFEQIDFLTFIRQMFLEMPFPEIAHISSLDIEARTFDHVWAAVEPVLKVWEGPGTSEVPG